MSKPSRHAGSTKTTRRDFIKRSALVASGVVAAGGSKVASAAGSYAGRRTKRVIIAGGGIAGLCCGYELMQRGHDVTILEASGRTGGHVLTLRDGLADGLYADAGAEHFTKPGYDLYWQYVKKFHLPVLPYPRRDNMIRFIDGKMYTEEMLADPTVLTRFDFNRREIDYLSRHAWWELPLLYFGPYLDNFEDEYRPFGAGLDQFDHLTVTELLQKDDASAAAIRFVGSSGSALQRLWHTAILKLRGVPIWPPQVFRLKGGNQLLTDTFASKLGSRVRLGCPIVGIEQGDTGVTVRYREFGQPQKMEAEYLVSCIPPTMFRRVPVTPDWPEAKAYVIRNVSYGSYSRVLFQSRTPYWKKHGLSPNIQFGQQALHGVWETAAEVEGERSLLMGSAAADVSAGRALATYRNYYPGKVDEIEQARVFDWSKDRWAASCERMPFPLGQLAKFWPNIMEPHGRIHFAGAYADNLNWGMEAATRSANRVAEVIHEA